MSQPSLEQMFFAAGEHQTAGRLAEAESLYREILKKEPYHPDVLHLLAVVLSQTNRFDEAIDLLGQALAHRPDDLNLHGDLGSVLLLAGRRAEAVLAFHRAMDLNPNDERILVLLAGGLRDAGDFAGALNAYQRAIDLSPSSSRALAGMGEILMGQGHYEPAIAIWRRALEIDPKDAGTAYNLGTVLRDAGRLDEAIATLRLSLATHHDQPKAWNNLAGMLKDAGELDESIACYDRAMALNPKSAAYHSNRLYTLYFHPAYDSKRLLGEHLEYVRRHIANIRPAAKHHNDPNPDRPLRVGYVSADFRRHPVGLCFQMLLENHDRQNFSLICFSDVVRPDAETQRTAEQADEWHSIASQSDDQLVELIRDRRIDILVDLSLHMARNHLTAFARKPAPVQVTYLGYPGTTGLSAIDYRLSDSSIDPPGTDADYTEKTIRLPRTYLCWRWNGPEVPLRLLPARVNKFITFGCLNNFCKVTPQVLQIWGELMSALPNSRLILRCPSGSTSERVLAAFARRGIDANRVELVGALPWDQYVALYHRMDIGLDPFPYPGHTTSLDSLWMGVPLVTLSGNTPVSRAGVSVLNTIELPELIAADAAQYISLVRSLAGDLRRLAGYRGSLRERIRRSPLSDGSYFAREVEAAYRQMWHTWCRSRR